MTLARTSGTLGIVALTVIASPFAVAADSGWYVGGNVGRSKAHFDDAQITGSVLTPGLTAVSIAEDSRDIGYKVFGGYQFNRNLALEGGYFDLGKFGLTATTVPAGTLTGKIKVKGLNLDAVGILPLTEKLSALGRVGVQYAETKDSFAGTGAVVVTNPNRSKRDTNYKFGLGVQYDFTESLGMRVEVERYRINDAVGHKGNVDLCSIGLVYRFGGKTPAPAPVFRPAAVTPPPPPQAVTPPPAPKAVTPPPPPQAVTPPPPPQEAVTPPPARQQAPARRDRY